MSGFAKKLKLAGGSMLLLAVAVLIFLLYANYSDGERAGVPVKFSRKGVVKDRFVVYQQPNNSF